jgi:cysteine desulfurase
MDELTSIYLDNCATTPVHPEVVEAMLPYFGAFYGNPSSIHSFGRKAKKALTVAREQVAQLIGADPSEIVFTSGGTEADNFAIRGISSASEKKGNHIITSSIEHHAVLNTCRYLEQRGFHVTCLPVDGDGLVDPDDVTKALCGRTILISIMHANNEIGTIEPISDIAGIAKEKGIIFHTDAVQTVGKIPVNVELLNVDLLSLSGHKIYGPKGVGALYIRKGVDIVPMLYGGEQEGGLRHGTESIPAIVGLGKACEIALRDLTFQMEYLKNLRDHLQKSILEEIPDSYVNGSQEKRLPHILNLSVASIEAESIVRDLDKKGIAISAGSACTSDSIEISHVIAALGIPKHVAGGSIRFSLGRYNTPEQIVSVIQILGDVVQKLRGMAELERSLGKRGCL